MRATLILVFIFAIYNNSFGQNYLLSNEKIIYSFNTVNGKKMVLAKDTADKYIVYRFGTKNNIELVFPSDKTKNSWKKFKYSFYLRGGGAQNEGMDLNYVYFENNNLKYIIYYLYSASDEQLKCGIKIINPKTNKSTDIVGDIKSISGNITDFRDNKLIEIGDELFD